MFEKEVTRYYCLRCKRVSKNLRMGKCPYCGGATEEVKIERSRWGRIGKPVAIIFGVVFWMGSFVLILIGHGNLLLGGIFMLIPCFLSALFFFMIFSIKDENIIAAKISEMKGIESPVDFLSLHSGVKKGEKVCYNCLRPFPANVTKCPYCGFENR